MFNQSNFNNYFTFPISQFKKHGYVFNNYFKFIKKKNFYKIFIKH
jgi:hypothetical protein